MASITRDAHQPPKSPFWIACFNGVGSDGEANGVGRSQSSLSFHSLRHGFVSAMANAGVAQELRQKLTGHASAEMNAQYAHHELESLRAAVSVIPSIGSK